MVNSYSLTLCKGFIVKNNNATESYKYASENEHHRPYCADGNFTVTSEAMKNIATFHPKKGEEYSVAEVNVSYNEFNGFLSKPYNAIILDVTSTVDKTSTSVKIFGWIDKAEEISLASKENTRIFWHIDHWLTALKMSTRTLSMLEGRIKRGPASLARPDSSQPRMWIESGIDPLPIQISNESSDIWAIVLSTYTIKYKTSESSEYQTLTVFDVHFWPTGTTEKTVPYGDSTLRTMSLDLIYGGRLEEYMDRDPGSIIGIWFSPIAPANPTSVYASLLAPGSVYGAYRLELGDLRLGKPRGIDKDYSIKTDDFFKILVIDPYNAICGTLPWGLETSVITAAIDIGTNGAYLILDFLGATRKSVPGTGRQMQIPLISAPITSNALSSYVYSGQRDYDIYTAQLQAEQNRKSGIANAGSSALSGAVGGAVAGGAVGAGIGAIAGLATSVFGSQINYQLTKDYDKKIQEATDALTSNQTASVLISGGGTAWFGKTWRIIKLARDTVSDLELTREQKNLGYATDSFQENCKTLINKGGPLRIDSLHVEGLSPEGNKYVQNMFQGGCYLDLITNVYESAATEGSVTLKGE